MYIISRVRGRQLLLESGPQLTPRLARYQHSPSLSTFTSLPHSLGCKYNRRGCQFPSTPLSVPFPSLPSYGGGLRSDARHMIHPNRPQYLNSRDGSEVFDPSWVYIFPITLWFSNEASDEVSDFLHFNHDKCGILVLDNFYFEVQSRRIAIFTLLNCKFAN